MSDPWILTVSREDASSIDEAAVARALGLLCPEAAFEIRGLPQGSSRICRSAEEGVRAAAAMAGGIGTYYTLNPCRADLDRPARETDITARRWLLLDLDATRPKDTNATAAEKEQALDVAYKILAYLTAERGWPSPVVIDSGNGYHLLFRCDLGVDKLTKQYVKGLLSALAARFDTDAVKVDTSVHNNARIAKLPGTWARKGPHSEDRPHRRCEILWTPASLECVTLEQVRAELPAEPSRPAGPPPSPARAAITSIERYCQRALESAACAVLMAPKQQAHDTLRAQVYGLAGYLHTGGITEFEIRRTLRQAAVGRRIPDKEADDLIESGIVKGREAPRSLPAELRVQVRAAVHPEPEADDDEPESDSQDKPLIVWASAIKPSKVDWLWPNRIALGKLTTFAGPGGIGKTFVLCDIMARVSTGAPWPFSTVRAPKGQCLFISAEDDEDDTLVPRLMECEADLSKIAFLSAKSQENFHLAARDLLVQAVDQMGDVRFVAIDPPTSYLAGIDDHKNAELRTVITPLKHWAAKHKIALVFNTHVNKGGAGVDAAARVIGGVTWVNGVRAAHMFLPDPDNEATTLFMPLKINVGKKPKSLSYRITETRDELAKVEWIAESNILPNDVVNKERRKPKQQTIGEWFAELFDSNEEVKSDRFWKEADQREIGEAAIRAFREREKWPQCRKVTDRNGDVCHVWYVPDREVFARFVADLRNTKDIGVST